MIRKITLTLFSLFTALGFSQTDIASSNLFSSGPAAWPYVFTACTVNDGNQGEQQTLVINITSLPSAGANYQVYKTTANGSDFFSNAQPLSLGLNTLNVNAVSFARAVKFRFSSGDIVFDSLVLNGSSLYGDDSGGGGTGGEECTGTSSLFNSGPAAWPYVFTACTLNDGNQGEQQTLAINITSLPSAGANYQVYKTTANGSDFFANAQPLSTGLNTINVNAVSFARAVKFRFNSPDICFDSFSLNGNELLGLEDFNSSVLAVYPNPATDKITIDGVENISSIKVYSISGRLEKEVFNSNQVDISNLASGIYLVKVSNGNAVLSEKIIKQ